MYLSGNYVSRIAAFAAIAMIAGSTLAAAPPERVKSSASDASIGGYLNDGAGTEGFFNANTSVTTTDGVTTTQSFLGINVFGPACNIGVFEQPLEAIVTLDNRGTSATVSYVTPGGVSVLVTANADETFHSTIRGTIRETSGTTNRIAVEQDEAPITSSQVDITVNGSPCFSGSLTSFPWSTFAPSITSSQTKVTTIN